MFCIEDIILPFVPSNTLLTLNAESVLLSDIEPVEAIRLPIGMAPVDRSAIILFTLNDSVLSVQSITSLGLSSIRSNGASGWLMALTTMRRPAIIWNSR